MSKEKSYHICHYCLDFISEYKNDVVKHYNKKINCIPYSLFYSYEEAYLNSIFKKFVFKFDYNELDKNDLLFITKNYNNNINYISENFKEIENLKIIENSNNKIDNEKELENKKKFVCEFCGTSYSSKQNLIIHSRNTKLCAQKKEYNDLMLKFEEEKKIKIMIKIIN